MRKLLIACLLGTAIFPLALQAQEQPSAATKAEQYLQRGEYANAILILEQLAQKKNVSTMNLERLAESYLFLNRYDLAENTYAKVLQRDDYQQSSLMNYADVLKQSAKYAEAKEQYQKYVGKYGSSPQLTVAMAGADSAQVWMKSPTKHKVKNQELVNTDRAEFGVFPTKRFGLLYTAEPDAFSAKKSGMTGESYLKIFATTANNADGGMANGTRLNEPFNDAKYHVGPVITNAREDVLYLTRTYLGNQGERFKAFGKNVKQSNLELKIYKLEGSAWKEIDFPYNKVKEYSVGHAALSADEKKLYFASDMPGGLGGVDIWYCELQADGSWGKPVNAGSSINSSGDEMFPAVHGEELYFSSNGRAGMGGLDIFYAKGSKGNFSPAKNMKYPINSPADDFALIYTGQSANKSAGYFASNRVGGVGSDDIYAFDYIKPVITILLEGTTINKNTQELLPGTNITLFVDGRKVVGTMRADESTLFRFPLTENTNYKVLAEKPDFVGDSLLIAAVSATQDTVIRVRLALTPIPDFAVKDKFVLENIHYDFDKSNIRPDAAVILDHLVYIMKERPGLHIELSSHTDSRGTNAYNMQLSQRRAQAAVDYIVRRGIDRSRLVAKGYGETRLLNRCADDVKCSDAEHQGNRRTEVEVLKK